MTFAITIKTVHDIEICGFLRPSAKLSSCLPSLFLWTCSMDRLRWQHNGWAFPLVHGKGITNESLFTLTLASSKVIPSNATFFRVILPILLTTARWWVTWEHHHETRLLSCNMHLSPFSHSQRRSFIQSSYEISRRGQQRRLASTWRMTLIGEWLVPWIFWVKICSS